MDKKDRLLKFIEDNDCVDTGEFAICMSRTIDSSINGMCVTLAGFALYLGFENADECAIAIDPHDDWLAGNSYDEFIRVFNYAQDNWYGKFWDTPEAKKQYIF